MDGQIFYIDEKKETASQELAYLLQKCMRMVEKPWKELVFLCIGSDRITGDSLGPLIGRQLLCHRWQHSFIYGTLEEPVHALNLASVLEMIKKKHPAALTIAVDASLRFSRPCGIYLRRTGIHTSRRRSPQKSAGCRGYFYHRNRGSLRFSGTFSASTTRLSAVFRMADAIVKGILFTFSGHAKDLRFRTEECFPQEEFLLLSYPAKESALTVLSGTGNSGDGISRF